jgi:hypothetical protein
MLLGIRDGENPKGDDQAQNEADIFQPLHFKDATVRHGDFSPFTLTAVEKYDMV